MNSSKKAEKFYTSLMDLQNELEEAVLKKCQKFFKDILNSEKVSLLYKIHKLVEEEWSVVLTEAQEESKSHRVQNFLCNSCNKNFTSVSDGEAYENAEEYYNPEDSQYYQSEDFGSDDQENQDREQDMLNPEVIDDSDESAEIVEVDELQPAAMIFNRHQFKNLPLTVQLLQGTSELPMSNNSNEEEEDDPLGEEDADNSSSFHLQDRKDFLRRESVPMPTSSTASRLAMQLQQHRYQMNDQKIPISTLMNSIKASKDKRGKNILQNKVKRYECPYCNYKTEFSANLKSHIRVHTGERPYLCRVCSKAFSQKSSLNSHERNVHGGRLSAGPT